MDTSRRHMMQLAGAGLAGSALGATTRPAAAATAAVPAAAIGGPAVPDRKLEIVSLDQVEQEARKVMSPAGYAFIAGGSGDEWTLHENRRAFNDFSLLTHRLAGIAAREIDTRVDLLGHALAFPIIVAPMGGHFFANPAAENATAAGAGGAGTLYQSSGASFKPLEEIARATSGPKWFQLYFNADVGVTRSLLQRARDAGYSAIIITADALGPGTGDEFLRLGKPFPPGMTFGNHDPRQGGSGDFSKQKVELTPDDIGFVASVTGLPVIVKGILRASDADVAIKAGAAAIQVSNHGGRQLDGVPGAISVLADVVRVVDRRVPVIFDSGIRRGIDVFRALALGAQVVAVGRPVLYGSALGGAAGVQSVLEHLRDELRTTMLLAGARRIRDIDGSYLEEA